jgi:AcrR family transcriptional regulator
MRKRPKVMPGKSSGIAARRHARRREEILKAGLKVFAAKGFQGASMDDIALELEATKGLLYGHFKTKEEILNSILAENALVSGIESAMVAPEGVSLTEAVRLGVGRALALMDANLELMRFIHVQALLSSKEAEKVYSKFLNRLYEAAARWLESFKQRGQVRTDVDTQGLGRFMVDAVTNHFFQQQIFGSPPEPGYLDGILSVLREGVAPVIERGTPRQS